MPPHIYSIRFSKYSGAGNDFAIVDAIDLGSLTPVELALRICPRATGIGVDGLIVAERLAPDSLAARFFNPDGSEFSTCGNGTRCVARFAIHRGMATEPVLAVETAAGTVGAAVSGQDVTLDYRMEIWIDRPVEVPYEGEWRRGWLVHVGTPHLVLPIAAMPEGPIEPVAAPIRFHPSLGDDGANVDLVVPEGASEARIRTYERGVEAETLSCGSGAMATTLALHEEGLTGPALTLHTQSGDALEVSLLGPDGQATCRKVRLSGPARRIFDGEYPIRDG